MASGKGALDKNAFITPVLGTRARAPLGMKTTNAKAKAFQTPVGSGPDKEPEKTIQKQTSARRPKRVTHAETAKLEVHGDESPLRERELEVEYAPPPVKAIPYQSDVFPEGCINYKFAKGPGAIDALANARLQVDQQGRTRLDRELEASYAKSAKDADERILKMMEEDWTVGDVPETFRHLRNKEPEQKAKVTRQVKKPDAISNRAPATITSRRAAAALSGIPTTSNAPVAKPKPKPTVSFLSRKPAPLPTTNPSTVRNSAALNASRSTLGYSKGRSASGALRKPSALQDSFAPPLPQKRVGGGMTRSVSNISQASDTTITPARFAQKETEQEEWRSRLTFLNAFYGDDEDLEPGLRGVIPDSLRGADEEDEEFVLTIGTSSE
ncbi:hypothetical protein BJ875DRAFT_387346 [Amylocarpus encephaloides]|uniref:Uncharacterized protein n=1 Tax=Amylocarpus encephaloides TaxID=45428 RepID=A0A9P8C1S4_9HELO|nr:hypothetical protein BJ875DRAFT_387346 [Amylocarpus encephaloides]